MKFGLYIISFLLFFAADIQAQTCCSGGVPVSSNLGLPASAKNVLQFNISYDFNQLKTLLNGQDKLVDRSRERITNSLLLEIGYAVTNKLSIDLFVAGVQQIRNIEQGKLVDRSKTIGLGDLAVLFKYQLVNKESFGLAIGLGPKFPIGKSDLRDERGLRHVADLQPGSGAFDALFWSNIRWQVPFRKTANLRSQAIFSSKGINSDYLGLQRYQFGNELQWSWSISDRILINKLIIDPSLTFRYRRAWQDRIDHSFLPSTGGQWIFVEPGLSYWTNPDQQFSVTFTLPVFAKVIGTQLSPSMRFTIAYFQKFNFKKPLNKINIK